MAFSSESTTLREFKKCELIFDQTEARAILKFFFPSLAAIATCRIDDQLRGFAQGLLVEAIDASAAMGFVEALFKASANPTAGVKEALKKVAKDAAKNARRWFKNLNTSELEDIEIYESIRRTLSWNFSTYMRILLEGLATSARPPKQIVYHQPFV